MFPRKRLTTQDKDGNDITSTPLNKLLALAHHFSSSTKYFHISDLAESKKNNKSEKNHTAALYEAKCDNFSRRFDKNPTRIGVSSPLFFW